MSPILVDLPASDGPVTIDDATGSPVTLHETATRRLHSVSGLVAIPTPRASIRSRPTAHGVIDETHWTDGRLVALEGFIFGEDRAAAIRELRLIEKPLLETLDNGPALLKWTEQGNGGLALQAAVKLASDVELVLEGGPPILRYQAQLLAQDPRAYSQTLTTATGGTIGTSPGGMTFPRTFPITFAASAGGTVAVSNEGNRPTPAMFRLYGGVTVAQILLVGTAKKIAISGTIAPGDYLEIDAQARTMMLNGTSSALHYLDPAATTWFELPVGTSTIQAFAFAFDAVARCDVLYRSAYA